MDVRVLAPHLADFRAHRDGDALGLAVADEFGELGGALVVHALLLVERGLGEVHERGRIDVDIVEAGAQLLFDQRPHSAEFGLGVRPVLLGVHLDVVALDEEGPLEALAQRRRRHDGHVLRGALLGVSDLAARDLQHQRPHIQPRGGPEDGAGRVVGQHADVHRGRGERRDLALPARQIQLVDRSGAHPRLLPDLPDQPARLLARLGHAEDRLPREIVERRALADRRVLEAPQRGVECVRHGTVPPPPAVESRPRPRR